MTPTLRILTVTRKPDSASFEQRVLRYGPLLAERGIMLEHATLPGSLLAQHRVIHRAREFDGVWWHRHLLHPLLLGTLRKSAKRLVFDFDDPLIYSSDTGRVSLARKMRLAALLKRCDAALPASEYLASLARPRVKRVEITPMAIDLPAETAAPANEAIELLWLGSRATQPYLQMIRGPLRQAGVPLRLIAHEPMTFGDLRVNFRPWSPEEQERALRECHVGLCPMPDNPWTVGKCPFKVVQYMAYGLPWVGSAVGENKNARGGLVASTDSDWLEALQRLTGDAALRERLDREGRAYAEAHHDRRAIARRLADFWFDLVSR